MLYLVLLILWLVINGDALSDSGKCSLTVTQPLFTRETPRQQLQSTQGQSIKQPTKRSTDSASKILKKLRHRFSNMTQMDMEIIEGMITDVT